MEIEFRNPVLKSFVHAIGEDNNWSAVVKYVDGNVKKYPCVKGTLDDAINAMRSKGYTEYTIKEKLETEYRTIPGYPMYEFDGQNVRSYHKGQNGYLIRYSNYQDKIGYQLHRDGKRELFTIAQLRERMNIMAANTKQYIVGSTNGFGSVSFAENPKYHTTEQSARQETERLARTAPGKTFIYAEIKGSCVSGGLKWE